jgi:hypothetical protein
LPVGGRYKLTLGGCHQQPLLCCPTIVGALHVITITKDRPPAT